MNTFFLMKRTILIIASILVLILCGFSQDDRISGYYLHYPKKLFKTKGKICNCFEIFSFQQYGKCKYIYFCGDLGLINML